MEWFYMEELDLRDLLSYFWNRIIYFFIIVLFVVCLGCVYIIFVQKPVYTSKTSVILTGFSSEQSSITQSDLTVNSKLVSTYQVIVTSNRVLKQVIDNLNLDYTTDELINMISVSAVSDTEIIEIAVTNENATDACEIANELASVFSVEAKDLYNLSNVSILDNAEVAKVPSNMNIFKQIAIFGAVGVILAFTILFIIYYFDTTIKSTQDVERKLDLTILGSIPDYSKKKKAGSNI
jgi:capsular polysaccharide biosynthesis protein